MQACIKQKVMVMSEYKWTICAACDRTTDDKVPKQNMEIVNVALYCLKCTQGSLISAKN